MKQYEEPMKELNEVFRVDKRKLVASYISDRVEQSIDVKLKQSFYSDEVSKVFEDVINKDVERASLRMHDNSLRHVPSYDIVTGEVTGKSNGDNNFLRIQR